MNFKNTLAVTLGIIVGVIFFAANGCRKSGGSGRLKTPVIFIVPEGFPAPQYDFTSNPVTEEGFALGKKLFHDNRLSIGRDVSCGSCHQQMAAYTTFDHDLGHGTNNQHTTRNVPGIFNMAWQKEFGWDGKITNLKDQVMDCITDSEKMGETASGIAVKIDTSSDYRKLFTDVFGDGDVDEERLSNALSQFVVMIISAESKYDKVKKGELQFTANEQAGYDLFTVNCNSCHSEPLFTNLTYRNIGLAHRDFHEDAGRMLVTGNSNDSLKFKVPSLRNVSITSYYAHDGRFAGVSEVIEHYTSEVTDGQDVDPLVAGGIALTALEKFYLQEFLHTLSDSALVNNARFKP